MQITNRDTENDRKEMQNEHRKMQNVQEETQVNNKITRLEADGCKRKLNKDSDEEDEETCPMRL